ncbi:hypothetical protein ALO65_200172 [Pseudomonas syringae pv. papulans]|nr:hypothetical protein ALO65_200172 [Pseudomonas syringae pv. papulans]
MDEPLLTLRRRWPTDAYARRRALRILLRAGDGRGRARIAQLRRYRHSRELSGKVIHHQLHEQRKKAWPQYFW